jgi:hypothetical protein
MLSVGEKKDKIQKILANGDFLDITMKDISDKSGKISVSKKYTNCKVIVIIEKPESPEEKKGRGKNNA